MLNATPSPVISRLFALGVFLILIVLPAELWSQQEGQAALEPMYLRNQAGINRTIPQGRKLTLKGYPDRYFSVRGRLLGVSKDSVHLAMDPQGFEQAKVKIEDVGSISLLRIGWIIVGAVLLLYLGGTAAVIVAALVALGTTGGALALGVLFALLFGLPIFFCFKAGVRIYSMERWTIRRTR